MPPGRIRYYERDPLTRRDTHPFASGANTHAPIQLPFCGILRLAGVCLDLLQDLLEPIGLANVDYREVNGDARNEEHASN